MSKIILIEDSQPFADVLRLLLAPAKVIVAHDMATAEQIMKQAQAEDTVLVDLSLPDSAPCRTLSRIADWKTRKEAPRVIVMTGIYDQKTLDKAEATADALAWKHDKRGLFNVLTDLGVLRKRPRPVKPCTNEACVEQIEATVAHLIA